MDNFGFYPLLFRQKYIRRWGLMRNSRDESLSEHAYECAVLTHALALIGNRFFGKHYDGERAATLALYHDVPEVYTGDMPTPVKYYNTTSESEYLKIEGRAISTLLSKLPDELRPDYRSVFEADRELTPLVKAADKLCAYLKCLEEKRSGNRDFAFAEKKTLELLKAQHCEELDYFLEHVIPSFDLTLDEIQ